MIFIFLFKISEIFTVNTYNFYNRKEKETLLLLTHPPIHMDRSHFMKCPTILIGNEACQDIRGWLADQKVKPSNYGSPLCKMMGF